MSTDFRNHFLIAGRLSEAVGHSMVRRYGNATETEHGPLIDKPGNVFQARFGTFGDGESIFELFVDGKLPDHPIEQRLSEKDRQKIEDSLEGSHVTIIHSISGDNTSSRANSLLDGVYDLKTQYGVGSITVIAPHLPFMRNDRRFRKEQPDGSVITQRNAISSENYARRLHAEGADFLVGIEPHSRDGVSHYVKHFGNAARFINTGDFFAHDFKLEHPVVDANGNLLIVSGSPDGLNKPDDYGIHRAKSFAIALMEDTPFGNFGQGTDIRKIDAMFAIHKERKNEKETEIKEFHGDVMGKHCVLIDDIISSGGTTKDAARTLKDRGATRVTAIATHAVLTNGALKILLTSPYIDEVRMTDTIPSSTEKAENYLQDPKLVIKTVAPLILNTIEKDHIYNHNLTWKYPVRQDQAPTAINAPVLKPQF